MPPSRIIYALTEATDGTIRYVGMSSSGMKRPRQHVAPTIANNGNSPKHIWVRSLLANGLRPGIRVLQVCSSEEEMTLAEAEWICRLREQGVPLLNQVAGGRFKGPGLAPGRGAKIAAALRGKSKSADHRAAIGRAREGCSHSEAARAKISAAHKGRKFTPEHRAKIAAAVTAAKARKRAEAAHATEP